MNICCGSFLPTEDFQMHLTKYIEDTSAAKIDESITENANASLRRLGDLLMKGQRKKAPGDIELESIKVVKNLNTHLVAVEQTAGSENLLARWYY